MRTPRAILTDAFPARQRGMALGINGVAAISGSFIGLLAGGLLSEWNWRAIFWASVPVAVIGRRSGPTPRCTRSAARAAARLDIPGNVTFAIGMTALLAGITYGIQPYGGHTEGWLNPWVLAGLIGGIVLARRLSGRSRSVSHQPMFDPEAVPQPPIRAGQLRQPRRFDRPRRDAVPAHHLAAGDLAPAARVRRIPTPRSGPGIYLLPLTVGFLIAGPLSGVLSDRFGPRLFATTGQLIVAATFIALILLPVELPVLAVRARASP